MGTPEFSDPEALVRQVAKQIAAAELEMSETLHVASDMVQHRAKEKIGHYQLAVGEFVEWTQLKDSTKADRVAKGYPADEPLLRDGTLRDAIHTDVHRDHAFVGVESGLTPDGKSDIGDIAVYLEMGTANMPPRPFLGPALYEQRDEITKLLARSVFAAMRGIITR